MIIIIIILHFLGTTIQLFATMRLGMFCWQSHAMNDNQWISSYISIGNCQKPWWSTKVGQLVKYMKSGLRFNKISSIVFIDFNLILLRFSFRVAAEHSRAAAEAGRWVTNRVLMWNNLQNHLKIIRSAGVQTPRLLTIC